MERVAESARVEPLSGRSGRLRTLLVDDSPVFLRQLQRILKDDTRVEVIGEAFDGAAAIQAARALRPDLVLMDLQMPRLNGLEATARIRREMPEVIVIAMSILDAEAAQAAALANGADGFLVKTEFHHAFDKEIARVLKHRGGWSEASARFAEEHAGQLMADVENALENPILESAPMGILVADSKGRCLCANRAFLSMLECTPEELRGKLFAEFAVRDDADRFSWNSDH
ncbi:MAG: response regulator [Verrucomicrobiae bacterium]|nr:response regulator [Verrucomicrobiae bacterium]